MVRWICLFALAAAPVWSDGCPEAPDHSARIAELLQALQEAPGEMQAREISNQLWMLWDDAPDEPSQEMLNEGMRARGVYDFVRALDRLDALVAYCPFYAEGYNQRAFVNFLRQDYEAVLPDIDRALELNPTHIGALSGKAMTLLAMGRKREGQIVLRSALELNPWLSERALLQPIPDADDGEL